MDRGDQPRGSQSKKKKVIHRMFNKKMCTVVSPNPHNVIYEFQCVDVTLPRL